MAKIDQLTEMLKPAAEALGYECVGVEYLNQGKHSILRLYIDHVEGIQVEDCAKVSHQASGILEVEDPIASPYTLEVSSPGLDRPLFKLAHYAQSVDHQVTLRCHLGVDGRRNFKGKLHKIKDNQIVIQVDDQEFSIDFEDIDKANLVPDFV